MNRAVFLDRDGTIIVEKNYLSRPEDVVMLPGAPAALRRLGDAGFKLFIVSNQSGIGRGYFTLADAERVNEHLGRDLARDGGSKKFTSRPRRPASRAADASRRRSFCLMPATNSAWTWRTVT